MSRITRTDIALLCFELRAREVARTFGAYDTRVRTCTEYLRGTVYYCEYRLPGTSQWQEAAEGDSVGLALTNLRDALAQRLVDALPKN